MGFFDDIFGGLFDFDGNGKTTLDEEWIAYKIFEDINKDDNTETDEIYTEDDDTDTDDIFTEDDI